MSKLYTMEVLQAKSAADLEDLAMDHGIDTEQGVWAMIQALANVDAPTPEVVQVNVATVVSSPNGVIFSCGGNHATANVSSGLVGKTLGAAIDSLREVMNIPPTGRRVVFYNGMMTTDFNAVLKAGDLVDVSEPAAQKGIYII
jgi:hypothetical protein